MRLLEYKQELFGQGYTVIGGDMHYEKLRGNECQPIKMTRMDCGRVIPFMDDLIGMIHFNWDASKESQASCREKYAKILRENGLEWKLIAFSVSVGCLTLDFHNPTTNQTDWFSLKGGDFSFRFEVSHSDGRADTEYDVSIHHESDSHPGSAKVIERIGHIRREIDFCRTTLSCGSQYIEVTEYADL